MIIIIARILKIAAVVTVVSLSIGVAYAAFADKSKVAGATFTVGSADIKILSNVGQGVEDVNLVDETSGPNFNNITPNWKGDYLVKLYNNGTTDLSLTSHARYSTTNDTADLRSIIYIEPIEWNDTNANGVVDSGEEGVSKGKKTIVKWNTEGIDLGPIQTGQIRPFIFRFSTDSISDTKQGKTALIDIEVDSIGQ